MLYLYNN